MSKRILGALGAAAILAGCGGPGGSATATQALVSGTVAGSIFTPADAAAVVIPPTTCNVPGLGPVHVAGLAVGFGTFPGLCAYLQAGHLCDHKASATRAGVVVGKGGLFQRPGPVGPGTYAVDTSLPTPDWKGNATYTTGGAEATDGACSVTGNPSASAGSVTIAAVDGASAQGSLDVTFSDGSHLAGDFAVPLCPYTPDICGLIDGSACSGATPACVP